MSSKEMLPLCLIFLTFFLSLGGSFRALMIKAAAEGTGAGGLPVLDLQLDSHFQTLPVSSSLGNVVTNLLGRQAKWSNLGSEGRGCSNLTSHGPQVDILDFIRVELGSHLLRVVWLKCTKLRYVQDPLVSEWWMRAITCSPYHGVALEHVPM